MTDDASSVPTLEEVRTAVDPARWAVYEGVTGVLESLSERIEWERLYTTDADLQVYLEWGLFLEQMIPEIPGRVQAALPEGSSGELAELRDDVSWSLGRFEDALRQPLSVLRTGMLSAVSARREELPKAEVLELKEQICSAMADVYGRLRADLRRFCTFVVAEDRWELARLETVLFPGRLAELEHGKRLKEGLARLMEAFRGGPERVALGEVLGMWIRDEILAVHGMAELERVVGDLADLLDEEDRVALYVEDYLRLRHWGEGLRERFGSLGESLGDRASERVWLAEMAAILDAEILVGLLGWQRARGFRFPRDADQACHQVLRRPLSKAGFDDGEVDVLEAVKTRLAECGAPERLELDETESGLLERVVVQIEGRRLVDRLRNPLALPDSLRHLEHLHPVVQDAEDGLKTFLLLLYGQVQQRDLQLLEKDAGAISIGEKLLALQELEYRLERIESSVEAAAFEAVRDLFLAEGRPVLPRIWGNVRSFVTRIIREIVPRLERVATFPELDGADEALVDDLLRTCESICTVQSADVESVETLGPLVERLTGQLRQISALRINVDPPEEVPDIEQFLRTLG